MHDQAVFCELPVLQGKLLQAVRYMCGSTSSTKDCDCKHVAIAFVSDFHSPIDR